MTARTKQAPISSGFTADSTARGVLGDRRLDGQLAIVTGGYSGVGLETTRALANAGATVIVPAHNPDKARAAIGGMSNVELEQLDLAQPQTIDAFAARFLASRRPLHMLINNAGIMAAPLSRDARGFEAQLATNHIGHFQLSARLWPALKAARGARVIALSSRGHARSAFDFEDPQFERRAYDKWLAYGQSKTANVLFAVALDARGAAHGVRAFAVHPGAVLSTDLMRSLSAEEQQSVLDNARWAPFKNNEQGASTSVWCATSPQLANKGGVYCEDTNIADAVPADHPEARGVRPWAIDPEIAERLWKLSERWTSANEIPG